MFAATLLLLSSLTADYGPLTWDNLNSSDDWDCYTVDGTPYCEFDVAPCHYEESPDECTVVLAFRAGVSTHSVRPCASGIPGCQVETWTSPMVELDHQLIARPLHPDTW